MKVSKMLDYMTTGNSEGKGQMGGYQERAHFLQAELQSIKVQAAGKGLKACGVYGLCNLFLLVMQP